LNAGNGAFRGPGRVGDGIAGPIFGAGIGALGSPPGDKSPRGRGGASGIPDIPGIIVGVGKGGGAIAGRGAGRFAGKSAFGLIPGVRVARIASSMARRLRSSSVIPLFIGSIGMLFILSCY
jgi:hypothetical protein